MTSYRHPTEKEIREAMKKYGPTRAGEGDSPYTQELLDEMKGTDDESGNRRQR